jgi:signal transduction histidine kinase
MILNRFGVRGRLNLLLLLPVIALLVVATPLVIGQVTDARAAGRTADTADQARQVSRLVWELQRELLVTSAYVALPETDPRTVLDQQRTVAEAVDDARASLGPTASDELTGALTRLGSLDELRRNAVIRGVSPDSLARTYHAVTEAVIDALRLIPKGAGGTAGLDAESTKVLSGLEALLRAGEYSSLRGTALITASVSPVAGRKLLNDASANAQILTQRFVQQADVEHAALLVLVDQGESGRKVDALTRQVPSTGDPAATAAFVANALTSAESQAGLRRTVQDQVTTEIADAAAARGDASRGLAIAVGVGTVALLGLVVLFSVIVSRSIAEPLRRLTRSATTVADLTRAELTRVSDNEDSDEQVPQLAEVDVAPGGEVGELADSFNRVQSTAAALLDRQSSNRRNVSLMFANVARRTQNLVQRQLAVVDELERNEQDPALLERLYRLDHLSTRLRRSADKLLVIAGSREQSMTTRPIELATALRSALAEIEDYKRVHLRALPEVTLDSSAATDLVLLFAELLENATASSPPDTTIELSAKIRDDGSCLVLIVDHGVGMSAEQLAEENRRLVDRERLDIAPTGVLGLFVVGRLARRHSLGVELVETPGGGITALIAIPPELFVDQTSSRTGLLPAAPAALPGPAAPAIAAIVIPPPRAPDDDFVWFDAGSAGMAPAPAAPPAPVPVAAYTSSAPADDAYPYSRQEQPVAAFAREPREGAAPVVVSATAAPRSDSRQDDASRDGLRRRVRGAQLPSTVSAPSPRPVPEQRRHDAVAARSAMDDYQSAVANGAGPRGAPRDNIATASTPPAGDERRAGLTRRVPGATLGNDPPLEHWSSAMEMAVSERGVRDADADRRAFDEFAAGLALANQSVASGRLAPGSNDGHRNEAREENGQ